MRIAFAYAAALALSTAGAAIAAGGPNPSPAIAAAALTVTVAIARLLGAALLVATNCTVVVVFTLGAVKSPVPLIVPAETVHATSVLLAFRTCAANW